MSLGLWNSSKLMLYYHTYVVNMMFYCRVNWGIEPLRPCPGYIQFCVFSPLCMVWIWQFWTEETGKLGPHHTLGPSNSLPVKPTTPWPPNATVAWMGVTNTQSSFLDPFLHKVVFIIHPISEGVCCDSANYSLFENATHPCHPLYNLIT